MVCHRGVSLFSPHFCSAIHTSGTPSYKVIPLIRPNFNELRYLNTSRLYLSYKATPLIRPHFNELRYLNTSRLYTSYKAILSLQKMWSYKREATV